MNHRARRAVFCRTTPGGEYEVLLMYRKDLGHWDLPGYRENNNNGPTDPYQNFLCGVHEDCGSSTGTLIENLTISATKATHPQFSEVWRNTKKLMNVPKELLGSTREPLLSSQGHPIGYLLVQDWKLWRPVPTTKRKRAVQGFAWATLSATSAEGKLSLALLGRQKTTVSGSICQGARDVLSSPTLNGKVTPPLPLPLRALPS